MDENESSQSGVPEDIESRCDFFRVPQLSRMLGISSNSIHAQMRLGIFPIAHRRVGNVIVVRRVDYQAWFEAEQLPPPRRQASDESRPPKPRQAVEFERLTPEAMKVITGKESLAARKEREKQDVMRNLRRKGLIP